MRIDKNGVSEENRIEAASILQKLRDGSRLFGNVAEGLEKTLKKREKELEEFTKASNPLDFLHDDSEFREDIKKLKAGINGELKLAEYIETIIKLDDELQDIIFFASLADPDQQDIAKENGYISDSDFIAVYGNDILIIDAKNVNTTPEIPLFIQGKTLISAAGVEIYELHPAVHVWRKVFEKYGINYISSVHGCSVIVNNKGATIWRNPAWKASEAKPLHIAEFRQFLLDWIEKKDKNPVVNLNLLVTISKMQIRTGNSETDKIKEKMKSFGV